ncbi:MAG: hypothetical protein JWO08_4541 [Verrucomicrobiaceae bacterium]|nr:hypothetical protein [Verrucomicrobiaceae bacterium]
MKPNIAAPISSNMKSSLLSALLIACTSLIVHAADPLPPADDHFAANMRRVFENDRLADIRVTFGYDNWTDFKDPNDPGRARAFMVYLSQHQFVQTICTPALAEQLGVDADAQNLRIFEGPGYPGQRLRVSLIWSASTSSTARNIGVGYPRQLRCSGEALKFMQKASADAEVMIYVGHSRGGGGPDTYPPQAVIGNAEDRQKVDFSFYRRERPGLKALKPHFGKSPDKPYFVVWTGCYSENFSSWMSDRLGDRPDPASVVLSTRLTRQMPWIDGIEGADEGLMVVTRLIEALQQHQPKVLFQKNLAACELDEMRNPEKPEWRLMALPSAKKTTLAKK